MSSSPLSKPITIYIDADACPVKDEIYRVADRIAVFCRLLLKLARIGHKLPRNRIARIGRIDQVGHRRRDGDGIA